MSRPGTDMPAMPWYVRDWLTAADVQLWRPRQIRLDYFELLCHQWIAGFLPASPDDLRLMLHLTPKEWAPTWRAIESKFPLVGDKRRNPKLEEVRSACLAVREHRLRASRAGNAARWGAVIANGSQPESQTESESDRKRSPKRIAFSCSCRRVKVKSLTVVGS